MRDGILTHTGEREPETLEGKIVRHRRPRRLHQPRHRRRDPLRAARRARPAARRRSRSSARPGSKRIDTLVHDLDRDARRGAATSSRATRSAARCSRCARSCSSASTSARRPRRSTSARARRVRRIFDAPRRARRRRRRDRRVHRRDDRPLRAGIRCAARTSGARSRTRSVEAVKAGRRHRRGASSERTSAPQGRRTATWAAARSTRSGRRASRSTPVDKLYYCFGCGAGGDLITFVRETQGARLRRRDRVARRPLQRPDRVRGELAGSRTRAAAGASVCSTLLGPGGDRSTSATSGTRRRARLRRDYLAGRGLGEEICREFRLGLALGGNTLTRKALEKGFTREELRAAGPRDTTARRRLLPAPARSSRSPMRAAASSASRRAGCTRTIR